MVPAYEPGEVELQKQVILDEDLHLVDVEEMQCTDWERAQDADPVIKRLTELMREFVDIAPKKVQLRSDPAEVKSFCKHWNLLEIINGSMKRALKDLTGASCDAH